MYNARWGPLISFTVGSSKFQIGDIVCVFGNEIKPQSHLSSEIKNKMHTHTQPHTYALPMPRLHTTNPGRIKVTFMKTKQLYYTMILCLHPPGQFNHLKMPHELPTTTLFKVMASERLRSQIELYVQDWFANIQVLCIIRSHQQTPE